MTDMTPLYSLFALIPVILSGFVMYAHQRTYGNLNITTSSVAYNRDQFQHALDWDKYALSIEGEPTFIFSGEFHYWRVPDRERWETILKQYRSAGLNTIRIYFHWGYHSPKEGEYLFYGNRDVDYLLQLCEKLGLYVLAAPGPYICAETQAGGYPSWLVAKRDLNIRHNQIMLWRTYDEQFANYELQWFENILPIIASHQITENKGSKKGCVLALQIDNELFETMARILPIGLRDQMRILAKAARDAGITVPLFSNDGFEEGGWVPQEEKKGGFWSKNSFGIDLYGFDKYVIFAPSSSPKSWLINGGVSVGNWDEWNPKNMENSMDGLEKTVRGFGGGASKSPMFIPELQGGWFNHYQLQHTYDHIYDFYGAHYTKLLVESSLAQGVTLPSVYMIYGGTNWGTLGDPDVYTSYDYSACIREYGFMSSRGRLLRETILFVRSFDPYFTKTEVVTKPNVTSSVPNTINRQRVSVHSDQSVEFTFFRNFDRKRRGFFEVTTNTPSGKVKLGCSLPYKTSFIALGNYRTANGLHLILSTIPIHARLVNQETNEEVWIVEPNSIGEMAFASKEVQVSGNMQNEVLRRDGPASILSFDKTEGWTQLTTSTGHLYLIGITKEDTSTLYADFEEAYWNNGKKQYPAFVAWGADTIFYDRQDKKIEVNYRRSETSLHVVSFNPPADRKIWRSSRRLYEHAPMHYETDLQKHAHQKFPLPIQVSLDHWEERVVDFNSMPWASLMTLEGQKSPTWDAIDYHYTSGHTLYRTSFKTPPTDTPRVSLALNARHRATVLVNGQVVGGHTTYSRQLFQAGAKIGPDPWFIGTHTYDLSPYLSRQDMLDNELVILVDSFGLNRQAFIMNDVRNPRGILKANLNGLGRAGQKLAEERWEITGVDVRELSNAYNTTGFPDENQKEGWAKLKEVSRQETRFHVPVTREQGVRWLRCRFDYALKSASLSLNVPLRLHIDGRWTAKVFLNKVLIALYYGNGDGPQHDFYLPDDLVRQHGNEMEILAYSWEDTEAEISIRGWPVTSDSGNLITHDDDKPEYMVWKDELKWQNN